MKLSSMFLLGVGLLCLPVQAQFHPIGSTKPLPESAVPNIVLAVEDEIYDYKQEKSFVNIGSTGAIGVATQVPIYIAKSISDRNIGWVLYKDMPHGEVLSASLSRMMALWFSMVIQNSIFPRSSRTRRLSISMMKTYAGSSVRL
jgi:hypothetical protein